MGTEIFFGKSEIRLDNPRNSPHGQITSDEPTAPVGAQALIDALIVEQIN
jgi:hypothetical protein